MYKIKIIPLLLLSLLTCAVPALQGQTVSPSKPGTKKPVVTKTIKPAVESIRFYLDEMGDYGQRVLYTGEVKEGKANGYGKAFISFYAVTDTMDYFLGVYEGYWKNNAFHGKGHLYSNAKGNSGRTQYIGDFENGKYHGQGKLWPMYGTTNSNYKEGSFIKGVYVENSTLSDKKETPVITTNPQKKEADNNPKPSVNGNTATTSPARPADEMFYAKEADFANIDWDALGRRPEEPGYTTPSKIAFLEQVSKDVRKYLDETFVHNGATYKRYNRSKEVRTSSTIYSGQDVKLTGKSTQVVMLTYCKGFGTDAKAKISVKYNGNGKKLEGSTLTGANCNVTSQCSAAICKTVCTGALELESGNSSTLWLHKEGNWTGREKVYWVVLTDLKNTF